MFLGEEQPSQHAPARRERAATVPIALRTSEANCYALARWEGPPLFVGDGGIELREARRPLTCIGRAITKVYLAGRKWGHQPTWQGAKMTVHLAGQQIAL
jgi:hypothetical protein